MQSVTLPRDIAARSDEAWLAISGAISLGISQCIGAVRLISAIAIGVLHGIKAAYCAVQLSLAENAAIRNAPRHPYCLANDLTCQYYRYLLQYSRACLWHYSVDFGASLLALIPLVGMVAAGVFLAKVSKEQSPWTLEKSCHAFIEYAVEPFAPLARSMLYPLGYGNLSGQALPCRSYIASQNIARSYGDPNSAVCQEAYLDVAYRMLPVTVERGDGQEHAISCAYLPATAVFSGHLRRGIDSTINASKTMVLFPGNAMLGEDMVDVAAFYAEEGWNVLMVTVGGYPRSDASISTSEMSTIQDVAAILKFLEGRGVVQIGVHGCSIGGSLALHATQLSYFVTCAVIDKTFDSLQNVAINTANSHAITSLVPTEITAALFRKACPPGQLVPGVLGKDHLPYYTDGLDNKKKAGLFAGTLVTICGQQDHLMGCDYVLGQGHAGNLADRVHAAHCRAFGEGSSFLIHTQQGHSSTLLQESAAIIRQALAVANPR